MADAICRWRNPFIDNVIELIKVLPKEELPQQDARNLVLNNFKLNANFYTTPYQLACQLGLYHESNNRYFPKFTYQPTQDEVIDYLRNWIIHYSVPNPYTRGFDNLQPISIHSELCRRLLQSRRPLNWIDITNQIFNIVIGNEDILRNSISTHSSVLTISEGMIMLKDDKTYDDLVEYLDVDILIDRNDKEYFFDLFLAPLRDLKDFILEEEIVILPQIREITQTEKKQIISARIGQGIFRRNLIIDCSFCPITGIDDTNLLIASHIKPWRVSSNAERINHKNGILLTPTFDMLFDTGRISFTDDKELIISRLISEENRARLNLTDGMICDIFHIEGREEFLDFHRREIFIE